MKSLINRLIIHNAFIGLSGGLFLAIQGVFLLEKGVEVWQIGLLLGTYAFSSMLFELPLGALADIHGRVKIFRLSRIIFVLGITIALFSQELYGLLMAMVIMGLAQALNSGSIDAWQAERVAEAGKEDQLQSLISVWQMAMAAFLAIGAVAGGYLPEITPWPLFGQPTNWNLLAVIAVAATHLLASYYLFKEGDLKGVPEADDATVKGQIRIAFKYGLGHPVIRMVLLCGVLVGLAMANIEAFWQPTLKLLSEDIGYSTFGWITFGYFSMAIMGPMLTGILSGSFNVPPKALIIVLPSIVGSTMILLSIQNTVTGFVSCYFAFILFYSMMNPAVSAALHHDTPDKFRSTMMSTLSFTFMLGGAMSAYLLAPIVSALGVPAVWQGVATALVIFSLIYTFMTILRSVSGKNIIKWVVASHK